jgi:hypothetical protein
MLTYAGTLSALSGLDLTAADRLGVLQARPKKCKKKKKTFYLPL